MTSLLEKAFRKASELPSDLQNQLAEELLDEIDWEFQWDKSLADSQDVLEKLANAAVGEYEAGKTHPKGFDEL